LLELFADLLQALLKLIVSYYQVTKISFKLSGMLLRDVVVLYITTKGAGFAPPGFDVGHGSGLIPCLLEVELSRKGGADIYTSKVRL
jgi:hypothetical protein